LDRYGGALVLPEAMKEVIEQSIIRKPSSPRTLSVPSTTAIASLSNNGFSKANDALSG